MIWENNSSTFSCVKKSKLFPFGITYLINSRFLSHDALSVEQYGLVKNTLHKLRPYLSVSISWNLENSGPLSLKLIWNIYN